MEEVAPQSELKYRPIDRLADVLKTLPRLWQGVMPKVSSRTLALILCPCLVFAAGLLIMANLKFVQIIENGRSKTIATFSSTPAAILSGSGIKVSPYDKVVFSGYENNYGTITYFPAFKVSVTADGKTSHIMIPYGTVADALKKSGITVGSDDIVTQPLDSQLKAGESVAVKRVTYAIKTQPEPIAFSTVYQPTTLLKKGDMQVVCAGANGQKIVNAKITYIDGVDSNEQVYSETVSQNPTTQVVLTGTASNTPVSKLTASNLTLDSNGVPVSYSKCISGIATAYSAQRGTLTCTGRYVRVGYIAVNPRKIPLGSKLYVMSPSGYFVYGVAVAADTGEFATNGSGIVADLFFATNSECDSFGARKVNIYVLK